MTVLLAFNQPSEVTHTHQAALPHMQRFVPKGRRHVNRCEEERRTGGG